MNITIIGPQGSGKGTYSTAIKKDFGMEHISMGEILREIASHPTELGKKIKKMQLAGELVPDNIVLEALVEKLKTLKDGFILDGYPRTIAQAKMLDPALKTIGQKLDLALEVYVDDEECISRISARVQCRDCAAIYNLRAGFLKPKKEGICDKCGGELYVREDDKPAKVKHRLEIYHKSAKPIFDYYAQKGILKTVDASGGFQEAYPKIKAMLDSIQS